MRNIPKGFARKAQVAFGGSFVLFLIVFAATNMQPPKTFSETKAVLTKIWQYNNFTTDFYCNAPFEIIDSKLKLIESDRYTPRKPFTKKHKPNERTQIIEFEHIMPAYNFGRHLPCWREGGRKACKNDSTFNAMEADPYNLVPAIGEINADRSNFRYAEAPKNVRYTQYGQCAVYTDFKAKRFYPAHYSKGLIARTYLYMSKTYNIPLSKQERQLMEAWDAMYPKNDYEIARDSAIRQIFLWNMLAATKKAIGF